jgi:hypothetical protein
MVFINFNIALSSKGSSTGNAQIAGLPLSAAGTDIISISYFAHAALDALFTLPGCYTAATTLQLFESSPNTGANNTAMLTDTNFSNNSNIYASGFYFI